VSADGNRHRVSVSSGLGNPNRWHAFETGIYIDPCPPGLQSGQFAAMDIRPVRPSAGQATPEDRLPRQFLDLPKQTGTVMQYYSEVTCDGDVGKRGPQAPVPTD
jgi:hypothetical protein